MTIYFGTAAITEPGEQGYSSPDDWTGWTPPPPPPSDDDQYHPNPPPQMVPTDSGGSPGGTNWLQSLASIFSSTATGVAATAQMVNLNSHPINQGGSPRLTQPPPSAMPGWVLPVAVVGGILLLAVVVKKGRRTSVAGYRRRSRR